MLDLEKEFSNHVQTFAKEIVSFLNSLASKEDPFFIDQVWKTRMPSMYIMNKSKSFSFNISGITPTDDDKEWFFHCAILIGWTTPGVKSDNLVLISKNEAYTGKEMATAEKQVLALLKNAYEKQWTSAHSHALKENFKKDVETLAKEALMLLNKLAKGKDIFALHASTLQFIIASSIKQFKISIAGNTNSDYVLFFTKSIGRFDQEKNKETKILVGENAYTTKDLKTAKETIFKLTKEAYENDYSNAPPIPAYEIEYWKTHKKN